MKPSTLPPGANTGEVVTPPAFLIAGAAQFFQVCTLGRPDAQFPGRVVHAERGTGRTHGKARRQRHAKGAEPGETRTVRSPNSNLLPPDAQWVRLLSWVPPAKRAGCEKVRTPWPPERPTVPDASAPWLSHPAARARTHLDDVGDSCPQHLVAGVRGTGRRLVAGSALPGGAHGRGAGAGGRAAVRGGQAGRAAAAREPRARPLPGRRQAAEARAGEFQVGHLVEQVAQAARPIVGRPAQRFSGHQVGGRRRGRARRRDLATAAHRQVVQKVIDRCHRVIPEAVVLGAWKHAPPWARRIRPGAAGAGPGAGCRA